jgi:hypothetical protein
MSALHERAAQHFAADGRAEMSRILRAQNARHSGTPLSEALGVGSNVQR